MVKNRACRIRLAASIVVAAALALAGCGGSGSSSSGGGASSGTKYGIGLKLGPVITTYHDVSAVPGPWLVWDKSACTFKTASSHPSTYAAVLRKVTNAPKVGYMDYGDTDPFGVANSKNIKAVAARAGFPLDVYNLQNPSTTVPISVAHDAVTKQDAGVLEANFIAPTLPTFLHILVHQGCIPAIQMYLQWPNIPSFGTVWTQVGSVEGAWAGQQAKKLGWSPSSTALVMGIWPANGENVNSQFTPIPGAVTKAGFAIPSRNVFRLTTSSPEPQKNRIAFTDWLTAHPNFAHMIFVGDDDEATSGQILAAKQAGVLGKVLTITPGGDALGQHNVRAGLQSMSVAFFPEKYGDWLVPELEDVLAGNPVPAMTSSELVVLTKQNINQYYPGK